MALTPSSLETHTSDDKMKGALGGTSSSILFRPAVLGSNYHDHLQQQQEEEAATNNNIQTTRLSLINFRNNCGSAPPTTNYIDRSLLSFAQDSVWSNSGHLTSSCSFDSIGGTAATAFVQGPSTSCSANEVDPALAPGEWFCSDDDDPGIQLPNSLKRPNHNYTGDNSSQIAKRQCSSTSTSTKKLAKQKSSGASKDPQSIAAKNRRERISERLKMLQDLVPNGSKVDLVTMLEKAISYVKFLQLQVKVLATDEFWPAQGEKAPNISQVKEAIDAILLSSQTQRDRRDSCTTTTSTSKEQQLIAS